MEVRSPLILRASLGTPQAARQVPAKKDPDGGSFPAYPSGKSWDAASGKTGSGKKFYHNIIPGSAVKSEPFYVAIITPVIHYCMGGLEINVNSAVVTNNGKAIPGLYGAGVKATSLATLSGGGLTGAVESSKFSGGSYEDNMNNAATGKAAKTAKPAKEKKEKKASSGGG